MNKRFNKKPLVQALLSHRTMAWSAGLLLLSSVTHAQPAGGQIVSGQGSIQQIDPKTTVINQQSDRITLEFDQFNINIDETVRFEQPSASSVAINKILQGSASEIFGAITSNGKIILINPHGIIFGESARIDVGALVASGLNIDLDDIDKDQLKLFSQGEGGVVINQGLLQAASGGSISLIGQQVENTGVIIAKLGKVELQSGSEAILSFGKDNMIGVQVTKESIESILDSSAAVSNSGVINADGGQVILSGNASRDVFSQAVNNSGIVTANRIDKQGGRIFLSGNGGDVVNSGTLDARAALNQGEGGEIVVKGRNITQSGSMMADANEGKGGRIILQADADGGVALLVGTSKTSARSQKAQGGQVDILGDKIAIINQSVIDASGDTAGGRIRIGGDKRGQGATPTASKVVVGAQVAVKADAISEGNGGEIIVFAQESTTVLGSISAKGGEQSGDGGFVEISGVNSLRVDAALDLGASSGNLGSVLFDPVDIVIQGGVGDGSDINIDENLVADDSGAVDGSVLFNDIGDGSTPFIITESEIENTNANIILEATNSILVMGTFANDDVIIQPDQNLTLRTRNNNTDGTGGIDLSTSNSGALLNFRTQGSGMILIETGTGVDMGQAPITLGRLQTDGGSITVNGKDFIELNANIITTGGPVDFSGNVRIADGFDIIIDTTNGGVAAAGGSINITGALDGVNAIAANSEKLTLIAGSASDITVIGDIGASQTLEALAIASADTVLLDGDVHLANTDPAIEDQLFLQNIATSVTITGALNITDGNLLTIANPYSLSILGGGSITGSVVQIENTGGFILNNSDTLTFNAAEGLVNNTSTTTVQGSLTSQNGTIQLLQGINLSGNTQIQADQGNIDLINLIGNNQNLDLSAINGDISVDNASLLNSLTLLNSQSTTFNTALDAVTVDLVDTEDNGLIQFNANVTITGSLLTAVQGYQIAFVGGGSIAGDTTFDNTGGVIFNDAPTDTLTFLGSVTSLNSGTLLQGQVISQTGSIAFADTTLTDNAALMAGANITLGNVDGGTHNISLDASLTGQISIASINALDTLAVINSQDFTVLGATQAIDVDLQDTENSITFTQGINLTGQLVTSTEGFALNLLGGGSIAQVVSLNNTGGVTINNTPSQSFVFGQGVSNGSSVTNIQGSIVASTGDIGLLQGVNLNGNTQLNAQQGNIDLINLIGNSQNLDLAAANGTVLLDNTSQLNSLTLLNSQSATFNTALEAVTVDLVDTQDNGVILFNANVNITSGLLTAVEGYHVALVGGGSIAGNTTFENTGGVTLNDMRTDTLTFSGSVTSLNSDTQLQGQVISQSGAIALADTTLIDNTTLNASGNITLGNVLGGNRNISLDASALGQVSINTLAALDTLTVLNSQNFTVLGTTQAVNIDIQDTVNTVTFSGATNLTGRLSTTNAGFAVALLGAGSIEQAVNFTNTGGVSINSTDLQSFSFTGGITNLASNTSLQGTLTTNGASIDLTGGVSLAGNAFVNSNRALINLGAIQGNAFDLSLDSGNGTGAAPGMINLLSATNLADFNLIDSNGLTVSGAFQADNIHLIDTRNNATIRFNGALTINNSLITANEGYNVEINGGGVIAGTTVFNNTGTVTLNDAVSDQLVFVSGLDLGQVSANIQGVIETQNNSTIILNTVNLTGNTVLRSDEITINNTISGNGVSLALAPDDLTDAITIGGIDAVNLNELSLSQSELDNINEGLTLITIGDTLGLHTISVDNNGVSFKDALQLQTSGTGQIVVPGQLDTLASQNAASITVRGDISQGANIITQGANIDIIGDIHIMDSVSVKIDSSNNGAEPLGANIDIQGQIDGDTLSANGGEIITFNSGTLGQITISQALGTAQRLEAVIIENSATTQFSDSLVVSTLDLRASENTISLLGAVDIDAGLLTTADGFAVAILGGGLINGATTFFNSGGVALNGNTSTTLTFVDGVNSTVSVNDLQGMITTQNSGIDFGLVNLSGALNLSTNNTPINVSDIVGAARDLAVDAGTQGNIAINSLMGLGQVTLINGANITVSGLAQADSIDVQNSSNSVAFFGLLDISNNLTTQNNLFSLSILAGGTIGGQALLAHTGSTRINALETDTLVIGNGLIANNASADIIGNIQSNNQGIDFNNIQLLGNVHLASINGDISLSDVQGGANNLVVDAANTGLITINSLTGLDLFTITDSGSSTIQNNIQANTVDLQNSTNAITFNGNVDIQNQLITGNGSFTLSLLGGGTINGLTTFNNSGLLTLNSNQGQSLTFSGGVINNTSNVAAQGQIVTAGSVLQFNQAVNLLGNTQLDSESGEIRLGSINGGGFDLSLDAGDGGLNNAGVVNLSLVNNVGALSLVDSAGATIAGDLSADQFDILNTNTGQTVTVTGNLTVTNDVVVANQPFSVAFLSNANIGGQAIFGNTQGVVLNGLSAAQGLVSENSLTTLQGIISTNTGDLTLGNTSLSGASQLITQNNVITVAQVSGNGNDIAINAGASGSFNVDEITNIDQLDLVNSNNFIFNDSLSVSSLDIQAVGQVVRFSGALDIATGLSVGAGNFDIEILAGGQIAGSTNFANSGTTVLNSLVGQILIFTDGLTAQSGQLNTIGTINVQNNGISISDMHLLGNTDLLSQGFDINLTQITGDGISQIGLNAGSTGNINLANAGSVTSLARLTINNSLNTTIHSDLDGTLVNLLDTQNNVLFNNVVNLGGLSTADQGYSIVFNLGGNVAGQTILNNSGNITFNSDAAQSLTFSDGLISLDNTNNATRTNIIQGRINTTTGSIALGRTQLQADSQLQSNGSDIRLEATLDGLGNNIVLDSGVIGDIDVQGSVINLDRLTVANSNNTTFNQALTASTIDLQDSQSTIEFADAISTDQLLTTSRNYNVIVRGGTINQQTTFNNTGMVELDGTTQALGFVGGLVSNTALTQMQGVINSDQGSIEVMQAQLIGATQLTTGTGSIDLASVTSQNQADLSLESTGAGNIILARSGTTVGRGLAQLGDITIIGVNDLSVNGNIFSTGFIQQSGQGVTLIRGNINASVSGINLVGNNLSLEGGDLLTQGAGNIQIDMSTQLVADSVLQAQQGQIRFLGTVDSGNLQTSDLVLNTQGDIIFDSMLGQNQALGNVTIDNAQNTTFDDVIRAQGVIQTSGGTTNINGDLHLIAGGLGVDITANVLNLNIAAVNVEQGGGDVQLNAQNTRLMQDLNIDTQGSSIFINNQVTGGGIQSNLTLDTSGTGNIQFNGVIGGLGVDGLGNITIDNAQDVVMLQTTQINASQFIQNQGQGVTQIQGIINTSAANGDVFITTNHLEFNNVDINAGGGRFMANAPASLSGQTDITSLNNITFNGTVDGQGNLNLLGNAGAVVFGQAVGSSEQLGRVNIGSAQNVTVTDRLNALGFSQQSGQGQTQLLGDIQVGALGLSISTNETLVGSQRILATDNSSINFNTNTQVMGSIDLISQGAGDVSFQNLEAVAGVMDSRISIDGDQGNIDIQGNIGRGNGIAQLEFVNAQNIDISGNILVGALVQRAGSGVSTFNGNIETTSGNVSLASSGEVHFNGIEILVAQDSDALFNASVRVSDTTSILSQQGGRILFNGLLDAQQGAADRLVLASDSGNIDFRAAVGTINRLQGLELSTSGNISMLDINVIDALAINAGSADLNGRISTIDNDVRFNLINNGALLVGNNAAIDTGSGQGGISISAPIIAMASGGSLALRSGLGNIGIEGTLGNASNQLTALSVQDSNNFEFSNVFVSSDGIDVDVTGSIAQLGNIQSSSDVSLRAQGDINQALGMGISVLGGDTNVSLASQGNISLGQILVDSSSGNINLNVMGNIISANPFDPNVPDLVANTITVEGSVQPDGMLSLFGTSDRPFVQVANLIILRNVQTFLDFTAGAAVVNESASLLLSDFGTNAAEANASQREKLGVLVDVDPAIFGSLSNFNSDQYSVALPCDQVEEDLADERCQQQLLAYRDQYVNTRSDTEYLTDYTLPLPRFEVPTKGQVEISQSSSPDNNLNDPLLENGVGPTANAGAAPEKGSIINVEADQAQGATELILDPAINRALLIFD